MDVFAGFHGHVLAAVQEDVGGSGALAAKETGGLLKAHSDGPGKGATFTLTLPLHQKHPRTDAVS